MLPTTEQATLLTKHFGATRFVYNYFLAKRKKLYRETQQSSSYRIDSAELTQLKKELPWLKEINAQSLQYAVERVEDAYYGFFGYSLKNRKLKKRRGFPKFKKKSGRQSFRAKQNVRVCCGYLEIPKFNSKIRLIQHREVIGQIKHATISYDGTGDYYVSVAVERGFEQLQINNRSIAIDMNIDQEVDSNGKKYLNPRPLSRYEKRLRMLHKRMDRRKGKRKKDG